MLTCVAFIACAAAYYCGNNSNYNSGYDDGKAKGRREVEREVERKRKEQARGVETRREEQERERGREKMWEDWRRRGAEAVARNAAAANNGRATNNAAAARNAFHTDYRVDKPVRGRTDSSSRPQPEGRTPRDRYWTAPLQFHSPTAPQAPTTYNQPKPPTSAPTWPAQPPPSRRSAPTSESQNQRPSRNAVPLSPASHQMRGPSHGPRRKPRVASVYRAQASTAERFENAKTRPFPQNQKFGSDEVRRSRRGSISSRPEENRTEYAGEVESGQGAAQRRDGSVGEAEEWGEERRSPGLGKAALGDGGGGVASDVSRTSADPGFEARSPQKETLSLRSRSESPRGKPRSESSFSQSERSSAESGKRGQDDEEEREAVFPEEEGKSPSSRSSSRWEEPLSKSPSPGSDRSSVAGREERNQAENGREPGDLDEGRWPGPDVERNGEERLSRSRSESPRAEPLSKSSSRQSERASAAGSGERGRGEARSPDSEGDGNEEGRSGSRSPSLEVEVRDV